MDEVRIVRRRTHVWPVVIAVVILALVIAFVLFMNNGGVSTQQGWNGVIEWAVPTAEGAHYGIA